MWMKNSEGIFNPDTGILIFIQWSSDKQVFTVQLARTGYANQFNVGCGTEEQCKAILSNIEAQLNPINIGILHSGETELVERELRNMLGD